MEAHTGQFYLQKGYNVLYVQLGGFIGSPGVNTSEKSIYQDIEAIKRRLVDWGVTEVGYHGISMGTGAAMQAAAGETLVERLKTMFVVLDQPYTSAGGVAGNMTGPIGKGVLSAGCPVGMDVELPGGFWTKTDGLDNLRKAVILKEEDIPLICIERENDYYMGRKKRNGKYTENFARDILVARYGDEPTENLATLPGKHGSDSLKDLIMSTKI